MRRFAAIALFSLLFACPDKKPAQSENELERVRERTNTNIDHPTESPLKEDVDKLKERTNNNADR
jgi:hypothetical protein